MTLLWELARRRARGDDEHPFVTLRRARDVDDAARATGLPSATLHGVVSFYDALQDPRAPRACTGTACFWARGQRDADRGTPTAHCFGRCYAAPARSDDAAEPPIPFRSLVEPPVVLRHLLGGTDPWSDYDLPAADEILDAVVRSGLRGRGGAAYPTGAKWRVARDTVARDRVVVANGDEGDPGSYVDRLILKQDPHAVLAGMLACGRAIGATQGIVFVRGEYPRAAERMEAAIREANDRTRLSDEIDVRVVRGAGSYVAGEETALLRAIEGLRAEPWPKPPYPAVRGLYGLPTVVQNVETLATVPWVVREGRRSDTKAMCLSGAVTRPGVVEVALGTPLRRVLEEGGGGAPSGTRFELALVGGPMGRALVADELDVPVDYDALPGMGHGGIVVFDESLSIPALARHLYAFAASESCGSCTPCRVGTSLLAEQTSIPSLERLLDTLEMGSLCGLGMGVPRPIRDLIRHYGDRVLA